MHDTSIKTLRNRGVRRNKVDFDELMECTDDGYKGPPRVPGMASGPGFVTQMSMALSKIARRNKTVLPSEGISTEAPLVTAEGSEATGLEERPTSSAGDVGARGDSEGSSGLATSSLHLRGKTPSQTAARGRPGKASTDEAGEAGAGITSPGGSVG